MDEQHRRESDREQWRRIDEIAGALSRLAAAQEGVAVELRHISDYMKRTDTRLDSIDRDVRMLDAARNRLMGIVAGVGLASGAGGAGLATVIIRVLSQ